MYANPILNTIIFLQQFGVLVIYMTGRMAFKNVELA